MLISAENEVQKSNPDLKYGSCKKYFYEDDKILIESHFNNSEFVYDENCQFGTRSPYDVNSRKTKFIGSYGSIDIWLKPNMILVYHSDIDSNNMWRSPRSQDNFRSNLIFHKGRWVKYLQKISDQKRVELYKQAAPYRKKCEIAKKERKMAKQLEKKNKPSWLEQRKIDRQEKVEERQRKKEEKEKYKKATTPIDDSKLFKDI